MPEWVTHILDIALPIILGYLVWLLKEERKERKANTHGMREILGYMIDRWYEEFMLQGYITTDQRNTFEGVYNAYAANNGNGARAAKWKEIQKLHIDDTKSSISLYLQMVMDQRNCHEQEGSSK